jgi:elongation factor G
MEGLRKLHALTVTRFSMACMFMPHPVILLALKPVGAESLVFLRVLNRFQRRTTIICSMVELHLEIYVEHMKCKLGVACTTGKLHIAFRYTITQGSGFEYTHQKQTSGADQFVCVISHIELMNMDLETGKDMAFKSGVNNLMLTIIQVNLFKCVFGCARLACSARRLSRRSRSSSSQP